MCRRSGDALGQIRQTCTEYVQHMSTSYLQEFRAKFGSEIHIVLATKACNFNWTILAEFQWYHDNLQGGLSLTLGSG